MFSIQICSYSQNIENILKFFPHKSRTATELGGSLKGVPGLLRAVNISNIGQAKDTVKLPNSFLSLWFLH